MTLRDISSSPADPDRCAHASADGRRCVLSATHSACHVWERDPIRDRAESYIDSAIAEMGADVTAAERERAIGKVEKFARELDEATR